MRRAVRSVLGLRQINARWPYIWRNAELGRLAQDGNALVPHRCTGTGLGGVIMAYEMKEKMSPSDKATVVNLRSDYSFVLSNPWVAVGWRNQRYGEI